MVQGYSCCACMWSGTVLCHCAWIGFDCNYTPGVSVGNVLGVCMIVRIKVETWVQHTARSTHGQSVGAIRTFKALSQVQIIR